MNNRMQLSATSHGSKSRSPLRFGERWARWEDVKFFRSWLVYDSDLEASRSRGRLNWNMLAGLMAMVVISAGGWSCIGLLVRHLLK
jgi:hypothetical protein